MESKETEEIPSGVLYAEITSIKFGLASRQEICTSSINECPITHSSQLSNPFLGLPLEFGRCESCGTSDLGKCEGHFGYIQLPVPIYHPSHISELKRLLSTICLKCLKLRSNKSAIKGGLGERLLGSCCEDAALVSIRERKTSDGTCFLQLKINKSRYQDGFWKFLGRYGFRYGGDSSRTLLPCEVAEMLKKIPKDTRKKLAAKGYFPQDGYVVHYLPVPPNCLSVPDVSDGVRVMSSDLSLSILRKVLKQVEIIKNSRSGTPNFESHEVEANELQTMVNQYLEMRGTAKASRDVDTRYGISKETSDSATKTWLEKIRTLFIRKGSGFSSRSVITGDAYTKVNEIGVPFEIAQKITFEESVTVHNIQKLQGLVDQKKCLAYKDGLSTYSLKEGSKGYTLLKPGQVVHRRIMDGDIVFINRPPTTHKHSLQALSVYIHEDHTVKINPLICSPLGADFDGDCIHLFYPQSAAAKAEVLELFSVENQLLSSHSGNINLQLITDALLSLKMMFKRYFFDKKAAQQLAMHAFSHLPEASILKAHAYCVSWTASQILQTALPSGFDCSGDRYLIRKTEILKLDFNRDFLPSMLNEIVASVFFEKGPKEVLNFFNSLEPLLMESIFAEGCSLCLEDLCMSRHDILDIRENIEMVAPVLFHVRSTQNELVQLQLENHIRHAKLPVSHFILKLSTFGNLIDSRSDSAINKIVQQIGFLGLQLSNKGKFYSQSLFEDMAALYDCKYPFDQTKYPPAKYGLVKSSFVSGLDPYELMAHSISTREVIVRSTRGLSEPGTLFKNLMAILRDVVICYDGTVRNICSNSIIQLEYGAMPGSNIQVLFPPGEPVGVLAATAMSNPAYKAVLDSSPNSNSSWERMKEILLCRVNFRNEVIDRRVILYLNDCDCGRRYCQEKAAYLVQNHLRNISLKDVAVDFMIEYKDQQTVLEGSGIHAGLVGHIHLNGDRLEELNVSMLDVLQKCQEFLHQFRRKKKVGLLFKKTVLSVSNGCSFHHLCPGKKTETPCLSFSWTGANDDHLERIAHVLASILCPVLLDTIIKGDPRIASAKITWITPDSSTWIWNSCPDEKGELAVEVTLEKAVCKRSGDAWRTVMDCCIPVLHTIDTRRSIPYAIKQLQELLGISCSFDQVIQRLSKSVSMVAKGLLKEHLVLLADTMTYSGNLIGFNSAGYKALSRSLNVQIPFTEATLFTPRKCFERAAEKCHMDSLSSIVASCSWGKPVSVGTGSRFDVIWGTKEAELKHEIGIDVYSFLHMVRGTNMVEADTACLGVEVDNLEPEMGDDGLCSSPDDSNNNKPYFEDSAEFQNITETHGSNSSWEAVDANTNGSSGGDDWLSKARDNSVKSAGWDSAGVKDKNIGSNAEESNTWSSWGEGSKKNQNASSSEPSGEWNNNGTSWGKSKEVSKGESSWGGQQKTQKAVPDPTGEWNRNITSWSKSEEVSMGASIWGGQQKTKKSAPEPTGEWDINGTSLEKSKQVSTGGSSWGEGLQNTQEGAAEPSGDWDHKSKDASMAGSNKDQSNSWLEWKKDGTAMPQKNDSDSHLFGDCDSDVPSWGKKNPIVDMGGSNMDQSNSWSSWGKGSAAAPKRTQVDGSTVSVDLNNEDSLWDKKKDTNTPSWGSDKKTEKQDVSAAGGWGAGSGSSWGENEDKITGGSNWGSNKKGEKQDVAAGGCAATSDSSGGKYEDKSIGGTNLGSDKKLEKQAVGGWATAGSGSSWGKNEDQNTGGSNWGSDKKAEKQDVPAAGGWGAASESSWEKNKDKISVRRYEKQDVAGDGWGAVGKNEYTNTDGSYGVKENTSDERWDKMSEPAGSNANTSQSNSWLEWKQDKAADPPAPDNGWNAGGQSEKSWNISSQKAGQANTENPWRQQKKQFDGSRNRGSNPEWKIRKDRGPKPPEMFYGNSGAPHQHMFTVTRQRLDMFTSEEEEILSEVEPIMKSLRRIMHQSGYNNADPLSVDDGGYIVDHVLNYHPDKSAKIGSGIDHITVDRHSSFQDSRCLYVVSTDGRRMDFSYRKCLEQLIKTKYPNLWEEFIRKYFKRRHGVTTERSVPPLESQTVALPEESGAAQVDHQMGAPVEVTAGAEEKS